MGVGRGDESRLNVCASLVIHFAGVFYPFPTRGANEACSHAYLLSIMLMMMMYLPPPRGLSCQNGERDLHSEAPSSLSTPGAMPNEHRNLLNNCGISRSSSQNFLADELDKKVPTALCRMGDGEGTGGQFWLLHILAINNVMSGF